ncbi:MAG: isochorismatase family protein [Methylococcales bacterium]|nr:isochorismatase family protein [Methylococcales bacterium]
MTRHPNLLDSNHSLLVVIDMQARLSAAMPEQAVQSMTTNTARMLTAAQILGVPVLVTEQYPQGLGATTRDITDHLPPGAPVFAKTGFSCCQAAGFNQALLALGRRQIILAGQEAHVCVLQTALELLHLGHQVFVVEDALCSRLSSHMLSALQRMAQQGATIVCHESVLFEWLKDAAHADFKTISSLLR